MTKTNEALEAEILDAHRCSDIDRLAQLYWQASDKPMANGDIDQACFFLTQAHVFALEAGSNDAEQIAMALKKFNRM